MPANGRTFLTNNVEEVVFFKRKPLLAQSELAVPNWIDRQVTGVLDIQQILPHRFQTATDIDECHRRTVGGCLQKANLYRALQTALSRTNDPPAAHPKRDWRLSDACRLGFARVE
jgi:hypothetical protein